MSIETMTKIASVTTASDGTVNFTNIPQDYTDLLIRMSASDSSGNQTLITLFNADDTSFYAVRQVESGGTANTYVYNRGLRANFFTYAVGDVPTIGQDYYNNAEMYIGGYSSSNFKPVIYDSVIQTNGITLDYQSLQANIWQKTDPITAIRFYCPGTSVESQSTFTLYGIKNARKTAGNSIKATGGNISFDGTYVYHVFNSTGSFVPTQSLTADALVIAGGGSGASGGNSAGAGGGGAGGLLGFTNQYFSIGSSYVCTVGAGGAAVSQYGGTAANGNTGNDSQLASLTIAKGGGFGGGGLLDGVGTNGGNGGSGGGAGRWSNSASFFGGSPTSGQGFKGGDALSTGAGGRCAGGGGGAGQAGTNTTNVGTATGGNGVNTYESWARATNTGENGYYAGGGGGSAIGQGPAAGGLGGGGIGPLPLTTPSGATQTAGSGRPNTGSGGGGMGGGDIAQFKVSGSGGSGLIIIRYKA